LVVFSAMYLIGLPSLLCVGVILIAGALLVMKVYGMSNKYGEHGLMKAMARKQVPKIIKIRGRQVFLKKN